MAAIDSVKEMKIENPYVGVRAYEAEEANLFFGRDREASDLVSLIISERLVLFYAQSGAGKSSLLNTKIVPGLEAEGFEVLPIGRVKGDDTFELETKNIFIYNLLQSLHQPEQAPANIKSITLADFLNHLVFVDNTFQYDEAYQFTGYEELKPRVLIIDQFEEILTTNIAFWNQREEFFMQLSQAMQKDERLWVVLTMREDFIAGIDPYLHHLPGNLRNRYYMRRLSRDAAREAITKPAEMGGRTFSPKAIEILVDNLSQIRLPGRKKETPHDEYVEPVKRPGPYVEPMQLQVVCYQMWDDLKKRSDTVITEKDIHELANVDKALAQYYEDTIRKTVDIPEINISEIELRDWFERELITDAGTRDMVYRGETDTGGLPTKVADFIKSNFFMLRSEERSGGIWYELVHDTFVQPILDANNAWRANQPLIILARGWQASNYNDEKLLEGRQLTGFLKTDWQVLGPLVEKFIMASQDVQQKKEAEIEKRRQRRRQLTVSAFVIVTILIIGLLAVVAYQQYQSAQEQATRAEEQAILNNQIATEASKARDAEATAVFALSQAKTAEAEAKEERDNAAYQQNLAEIAATEALDQQARAEALKELADANAQEAETARATAEYNAELAQESANIAFSRQLAAQALGYLNTQPDLSSLLSIEAFGVNQTWEALGMLLANTQYGLQRTFQDVGPELPLQNTDITAVALSLDGERMAWSDADGNVTIYNYKNDSIELAEDAHDSAAGGLDFSPNGMTLASGGIDAQIYLWNVQTGIRGEPLRAVAGVTALEYSPDGRWLAAATGTAVSVWDLDNLDENPLILRGHTAKVNELTWSPDSKQIASGGGDRRVIIWDLANNQKANSFRDHKDQIRALAWSKSGLLASGSLDGDIYIRNMKTDELMGPYTPHEKDYGVYSLAFNYGGDLLASGGGDKRIILTDMHSMQEVGQFKDYYVYGVNCLAFLQSPGLNLLASGSFDNSLALHNVIPIQPLSEILQTFDGEIVALQVGVDNRGLLGEKKSKRCEIHEFKDVGVVSLFQIPGECISLAISPDLSKVSVGDTRAMIRIFDAVTGEQIGEPMRSDFGPAQAMAFNADGHMLASSHCVSQPQENSDLTCEDIRILLWDTINLQLSTSSDQSLTEQDMNPGKIYSLALKPDEDILAFGGENKLIYRWWIEEGEFLGDTGLPLDGHSDTVTTLSYGQMGMLPYDILASSSKDNTILFWNHETSQRLNVVLLHATQPLQSIAFSADGLHLFTGSTDGTLTMWDIDPQSWIDRLCVLSGRNLTWQEWQTFLPGIDYGRTCPQWPYPEDLPEAQQDTN